MTALPTAGVPSGPYPCLRAAEAHRVQLGHPLQWQIETDPERTSEIEVHFSTESSDRTRVDLEHRNLDRHGEGWEPMRDAVGSPEGWAVGLARFAARITEAG